MKTLSLWQPWAQLVALGAKRVETRGWGTRWRGTLGIHATKTFPQIARNVCTEEPFLSVLRAAGCPDGDEGWFERGKVLCRVELLDCVLITPYVQGALKAAYSERPLGDQVAVALPRAPHNRNGRHEFLLGRHELAFGDFRLHRWMWILGPPVLLRPPVAARGAQGLFHVDVNDLTKTPPGHR